MMLAIKLSLRPEKRAGSDETWDKPSKACAMRLTACGLQWEELPGEGLFTARKSNTTSKTPSALMAVRHFAARFRAAQRLDAEYVTEDNGRARPVMLHRAISARSSALSAF